MLYSALKRKNNSHRNITCSVLGSEVFGVSLTALKRLTGHLVLGGNCTNCKCILTWLLIHCIGRDGAFFSSFKLKRKSNSKHHRPRVVPTAAYLLTTFYFNKHIHTFHSVTRTYTHIHTMILNRTVFGVFDRTDFNVGKFRLVKLS